MSVRVLIVDARSKRSHALKSALEESGFEVLMVADESADLHVLIKRLEPDAVLIDTGLPSRDILEHLSQINRRYPRPMIMFSQDSDTQLTRDALRAGVSAYVVEGVVPSLVRSLVEVAIENFDAHHQLRQELTRTRESLAQRRTIDRAKTSLMERYGIDEQTAYSQMRKLAMDRRSSVADIAQQLLERLKDTPSNPPVSDHDDKHEGDDA
ncbi:putative transcriptional regulatory protein pdtaR [Halomonadaceae bacterium LMG 33818]|uniref:ANTAR domain-containing response regulator n=1 Tax=Cernens ardua TaxID=3402176 RepID=UPI003EDC7907